MIIFPEGTRTVPGQALQFQRGAANIVVRGRRAITPVIIHCDPPMLVKGVPWYQVPKRRSRFIIRVLAEQLPQEPAPAEGEMALAVRQLTRRLEYFFTQELLQHAAGKRDQAADHQQS